MACRRFRAVPCHAGTYLHSHPGAAAFVQTVGGRRTPMEAMSSRSLKNVGHVKTLSGMGGGQYAVVRYDCVFAHQAAVTESVTLVSENGARSVIAYRTES